MTVKPLRKRVLVKRREADEKIGSLYLPDVSRDKAQDRGRVVRIGPDIDPEEIGVGDEVMFGKYAGVDLEFDGEQFVMLEHDDVVAVLDK